MGPVAFESLNSSTPAADTAFLTYLAAAPAPTGSAPSASSFGSLRLEERHVAKVVRGPQQPPSRTQTQGVSNIGS